MGGQRPEICNLTTSEMRRQLCGDVDWRRHEHQLPTAAHALVSSRTGDVLPGADILHAQDQHSRASEECKLDACTIGTLVECQRACDALANCKGFARMNKDGDARGKCWLLGGGESVVADPTQMRYDLRFDVWERTEGGGGDGGGRDNDRDASGAAAGGGGGARPRPPPVPLEKDDDDRSARTTTTVAPLPRDVPTQNNNAAAPPPRVRRMEPEPVAPFGFGLIDAAGRHKRHSSSSSLAQTHSGGVDGRRRHPRYYDSLEAVTASSQQASRHAEPLHEFVSW